MAVKKEIARSGWQEIGGIALLAVCVLSVLSLFSYDAGDLRMLHQPPNDPPRNFIGPVGAWFSFLTYMGFGVAGYILPALFSYLGLMCLFKREGRLWSKFAWALVLMLAAAALLELNAATWEGVRDRLNVGSAGGLLGDVLSGRCLVPLLGRVGTGVLLTAALIIGLVMLIDIHPGTLMRHCWAYMQAGYARVQEARQARMDRLELMEAEQEQLSKRRRRLEQAVRETEPAPPKVRVRARPAAVEEPVEEPAPPPPPPPRARARMPDPEPVVEPTPEPVLEPETQAEAAEENEGGLSRLFSRKKSAHELLNAIW
jgi:S-DNA-T family DNA segregation ATPase FtsK/SpoIIIE